MYIPETRNSLSVFHLILKSAPMLFSTTTVALWCNTFPTCSHFFPRAFWNTGRSKDKSFLSGLQLWCPGKKKKKMVVYDGKIESDWAGTERGNNRRSRKGKNRQSLSGSIKNLPLRCLAFFCEWLQELSWVKEESCPTQWKPTQSHPMESFDHADMLSRC